MLEGSLDTARRQYEQTLAKQRSGLVPEVDALSSRVALERLKPSLESACTALLNDTAAFKRLIGVDQEEAVTLSGSLSDALIADDVDLSGVSATSASVAKLEKELEVARAAKAVTAGSYLLPTLSLGYSYNPTRTSAGGSEWTDAGYLSASVSLALDGYLPFSSTANAITSAKDGVRDAELKLADGRVGAAIETESYRREIRRSLASLSALRLAVDLAERTHELTEEAYRGGTKDLLRLQDAADSLQEAKTNLKKEEYALISAVLDLEYVTGVSFGTLGRQ
jgi:outer membrane protein TolC